MKSRQTTLGASYGPKELKLLCMAFDDAWEQLAPQVPGGASAIEAARLALADTILELAREGGVAPKQIADLAVRTMIDDPTKLRS